MRSLVAIDKLRQPHIGSIVYISAKKIKTFVTTWWASLLKMLCNLDGLKDPVKSGIVFQKKNSATIFEEVKTKHSTIVFCLNQTYIMIKNPPKNQNVSFLWGILN